MKQLVEAIKTDSLQNDQFPVSPERAQQLADLIQRTPGVVVYSEDVDPVLLKKIEDVEEKLKKLPAITTQDVADSINTTLKEAKNIVKQVESEGLEARRPFNEISKAIKKKEDKALLSLNALVATWNTKLTAFAREQERKKQEEEERIRKETQAAAQKEVDRIANIQGLKAKFHTGALKTIAEIATADQADEKYKSLTNLKFEEAIYMEFLPEMEALRAPLLEKIEGRKKAILEKITIDTEAEQKEIEQVQQEATQNITSASMNVYANAEMEADLRTSTLQGAQSVQKRWVYKGFTDLSKVPLQYLCVDEKAVKEAIKNGHYDIAGLIIEQDMSNISR